MTQNNEREALDVRYFNEKLRLVLEGLPNYTRSELARELQRLSNTASPISQNEQQPKQMPDGWKLIGKVSEMGVVWHKQNPHAHPVGTEFYAVTPTNTEVGE